jgi:hypothetical protein
MIDHAQQPRVDLVTFRQRLVEVHRPHHGAQIGGGDLLQRHEQVGHFIRRLGRVQHLKEQHAIGRHHRVVAGDDLLPRNVDHLLHHVHLAADAIEERGVEVEPRSRDRREAAEMLDRILIALRDDLHAGEQVKQHQQHDRCDQTQDHRPSPRLHQRRRI